jgi:N-acetylneuraminic acid mutarotase
MSRSPFGSSSWLKWPRRLAAGGFLFLLSSMMASSPSPAWRQLASYPRELGVAGVLAGIDDGVLIAAGGANFPDAPPWAGGRKVTYRDIFVYHPANDAWALAGNLPEPRGYSAVVATPRGLLVLGGENAEGVLADSLWLRRTGDAVTVTRGPDLPVPLTSPVAAVLGTHVYLAGGYGAGTPRLSVAGFWRLDLTRPDAGWEKLPVWPGPSRGQAVIAVHDGRILLFSGLELQPGADGKPQATYLVDAYAYAPATGWSRLPDPPRSAIAAPSPAPVSDGRVFLLGGVDGRLVGKQPRDTRVPGDIVWYDVKAQTWQAWDESWPDPVVTAPAVAHGDAWIFVSGETMAGVRTSHVWSWRPADTPAALSPSR